MIGTGLELKESSGGAWSLIRTAAKFWRVIAGFLFNMGRNDEASALEEKLSKLDPNSKSHPIWAVFYSGRVEEAIQLLLIESQSEPV